MPVGKPYVLDAQILAELEGGAKSTAEIARALKRITCDVNSRLRQMLHAGKVEKLGTKPDKTKPSRVWRLKEPA